MTLLQSFKEFAIGLGISSLGQESFILGRAPSSKETQDDLWWAIQNGGGIVSKNQTGEQRKQYIILINRRGRNMRQVEEDLLTLEENLNCDGCTQLEGFDTIDIEATILPNDDDLDSEDRKVGLLQVQITVYKEC